MGDLKQIESEESQRKIREAMKNLFSKKPDEGEKGAGFFLEDENVYRVRVPITFTASKEDGKSSN